MTDITLTSEITVRLIQQVGGDHMVVAAAKVSTSGEEAVKYARATCPIHHKGMPEHLTCEHCKPYLKQEQDNAGLIRYLIKMRHGTPFEHSSLTFFVHAPIFVWREWHRHRIGISYNEESGRYKNLSPVFYIAPPDRPTRKVDNWKPGRPKFEVDPFLVGRVNERNAEVYRLAYTRYLENLEDGADPGFARDCLPVGIYSSCWVTVNPRSLMNFLSLRTHEPMATFPSYPLYEIEVAARACEKIFATGWPITYQAFCDAGRVAP